MKTKIATVLLVLFFVLLNVSSLKATHLAGGNITYSCLSGNTYQIKLTLLRDCKGIALPVPTLTVSGCGNTISVPYTGATVTPVLVTQPCNATVRTACDIPVGTAPGIQRYDYIFTYTLPAPLAACADVMFSYDVASRSSAITTLNSPGGINMRLEAHPNPVAVPCNTSPTFQNQANLYSIMFLCLNQQNCFNYAVTEPDGDSISYDWMTPLQASGTAVQYISAGFDSAHCITGAQTLNPVTGDICMTPTLAGQVSVMAVKVTEWRRINGVMTKIGWVERDIQIYMISCANNLPTASGINGTNQFNASILAGVQSCFDIFSNDIDVADSVKMNPGSCAPGSFSVSGGKRPVGHYCINTTLADSGKTYCCTMGVNDNACPQIGTRTYTYCLTVVNSGATVPVNNMPYQNYSVIVAPNPFSKTTKIALQNLPQLTNTQFTLTDIFGRNVLNKKMDKNELVIERENLVGGIYFYSIHDNNKMIAAGKILIVE